MCVFGLVDEKEGILQKFFFVFVFIELGGKRISGDVMWEKVRG